MPGKKKGRPSRYNSDVNSDVEKAVKLLESGITDEALAEFFDVSRATISNWKNDHPEFLDTIKRVKAYPDAQVERALFERATGYSHPEVKVFHDQGEIYTWEGVKHYPPDTAAAFIWLKNRQPQRWRDKQEIEHSGGITVTFDESARDV